MVLKLSRIGRFRKEKLLSLILLVENLASIKWCKKLDWNPGTWVLIWQFSVRAFQWMPTWQGLDDSIDLFLLVHGQKKPQHQKGYYTDIWYFNSPEYEDMIPTDSLVSVTMQGLWVWEGLIFCCPWNNHGKMAPSLPCVVKRSLNHMKHIKSMGFLCISVYWDTSSYGTLAVSTLRMWFAVFLLDAKNSVISWRLARVGWACLFPFVWVSAS